MRTVVAIAKCARFNCFCARCDSCSGKYASDAASDCVLNEEDTHRDDQSLSRPPSSASNSSSSIHFESVTMAANGKTSPIDITFFENYTMQNIDAPVVEYIINDLGAEVKQDDGLITQLSPDVARDKITLLENEVEMLRIELERTRESAKRAQESERALRERLSQHIVRQFGLDNSQFEDINKGENRPTELIRKFGDIYLEERVDALDAMDSFPELDDMYVLKGKIVFSIMVLSFRSSQESFRELKSNLHKLLRLDVRQTECLDQLGSEMIQHLNTYLKERSARFDLSQNVEDVSKQIFATLYDYPSLQKCQPLIDYIKHSVKLAWLMTVQNPSYSITYDARLFHPDFHTRVHPSDPDSDEVQSFVWPALIEGDDGLCVSKAKVIT